jgi:hypothetical protein
MAESDAAGPAPSGGPQPPAQKGSRSLTLAEVQRDIAHQLEPLEAARQEFERSMAPMLAAVRTVERQQKQIAAMVDRAIGPYLRTLTGTPAQKKAAAPSQDSAGRPPSPAPAAPAFDASPATMAALVDMVAAEVLKTLAGSRTDETAAFAEEIRAAVADEVRKAIAEAAASKQGRKRKRTVDNLDVHQWVMAMATADRSFRHLSQKQAEKLGPFKARTIGTSWAWLQMKADLETEAAENAERAKAELEDRLGEEERGFRQSSTKHGIGIQRPTRKDLQHERDVEAFLRATADKPRKKRAE